MASMELTIVPEGSWFHYLCKNITLRHQADGASWIADPRQGQDVPRLRQADWTWVRSGYFLRWRAKPNSNTEVTLICFEAASDLKQRFRHLKLPESCENALNDPWSLFVVVLDELFLQMSRTVWDVSHVFGDIEMVR
jgi:hypothetical protein